jgi:superfamily II DNA or RNA helicase/predicted RNA methylase
MIILFAKSQFNLFDAPVNVAAHVRRDGTVVKPHTRIQKIAFQQHSLFEHSVKPPVAAAQRTKLDVFLSRYGGASGMARILADLPEGQQQQLIAKMAEIGKTTPEAVADRLAMGAGASVVDAPAALDLFSQPIVEDVKPAKFQAGDIVTFDSKGKTITARVMEHRFDGIVSTSVVEVPARSAFKVGVTVNRVASDLTLKHRAADDVSKIAEKVDTSPEPVQETPKNEQVAPEIVTYTTAKGKTLRGVVRTDLTKEQALAIDPYTMRHQGGWFIREKHLGASANSAKPVTARAPVPAPAPEPEPAPAPAVSHDPTAPFGVPAGISKPKRREINAGVVARLAEGGPYSADDLAMFRQYSGNGGCGDSLNEFYTDPGVARGMWATIAALGVTSGTALEPSCATGVFLHTAPAGFRVTGVELESVSAQAASALHGDRHEIHTASLERFATTDDRQFDVVIGNPPYGPRGFLAKDDKKDISTCEQYFTDTALDKCKPGGIVALVVPTGIMDSKTNRSLRQQMLTKGEFLGAQRMPNTAFEHSHTEVTTDVIYLRKRPDDVAGALGTVDQAALQKLGVWDDEFLSGSYFTGRGAGNVLGTMTEGWRAKAGMGNDITVEGSMDGVADAIAGFRPDSDSAPATGVTMHQVLEALGEDEAAKNRAVSAAFRRPYANMAKVGDTKTVDGVQYVLQGDPARWHRVDEFMQTSAISEAQALAAEIDMLMTGAGAVDRPALESKIRAYVKTHGVPADNVDLMTAASVDRQLFRMIGAVNRKGELSDAVTGTLRKTDGGFDATAQLLALEHDGGTFTAAELSERLGKPLDDIIDQLAADPRYAYAGAGQWSTMDAYLTGELWPKLDAARAALEAGSEPDMADKRRMQAERLEKAIDAKSLDDVDFQLNSAFLPAHVVEAYLNWRQYESEEHANDWTKKQPPVTITFADGVYAVGGGNTYGDTKLLDKYLNRTGIRKEEDKPRIDAMNEEFREWLCASSYRDAVEDLYNRTFRGFVAPEYSNEPIDVPGLATDRSVRDWRWSSLRRSLATGKGIIADDVGLGKTLGGLLLARMAKIQGSAKKPIIVVPKSVLANWYAESQVWFPGSRVLSIGANFAQGKDGELIGKDDSAAERKRKYHDLTQNDYDFILISEPAFEEIDLDPVTKEEYYSSDFWVQRGQSLGNAGDKRRKAIKERYEQHIAQREFSDRTDAIWFNELGVDMLIADEMHHQKNLYAAKARFGDQPKFLGGQGLSNRALDFNLKTRWIREKNDGKNVHGLTATPTKNSPLEIYSMLSHIAPEAFERIAIRNSEEFLDRFCEFQQDKVLSTAGAIEDATVVSGFKNLGELREIMSRFIDRRTAEQVGLKLPSRDDRMHLVDMTKAQQNVYAELRELAEESAGKKDATGDAHIFAIMDKMNKAALDLSLLDPVTHAGAESPKYAELAKQCLEGAKQGGQIVFSEYIASHDKIVAALVDAGFKRSEIGVINAQVAGSSIKRQNIAEALNNGKLKVVVGNCTMAEGLNMQKTTTDIHHMDVPWEPATLQQRNGRGLRQGNMNESLRIHTYLSKGSFDGYRYQAVAAKKDWQDLLWNGGDRVENLAREGKISLDDMRIMLAADPEAARASFEDDKKAAMERYETGQRDAAQKDFVRFAEMSRSYKALKNKDTGSATRLRQKLEASKTSLFNNKYWPAKAALDSGTDVLIHPQTGTVLMANQGMDFGKDGKMVVTGVNMKAGTVTMRRHADTAGGRAVTVPMSELSDAKPFAFDAAAEASEVGKIWEAQAAEKLNSLEKWADVKSLPSSVLEANNDAIQRQIKDAMVAYKGFHDIGDPYMVEKSTGKISKVASYSARGMHDTHDYLLPTDANKEKAIQEWIDERRGATLGIEYVSRKSGRGSRSGGSDRLARRSYKGASYSDKNINPMQRLLKELSGGSTYGIDSVLEKQAKARLKTEQMQRIRRATSINDVIEGLMPLAKVSGTRASNNSMGGYSNDGSNTAKYPKDALAMAWARARHLGQLDTPVFGGAHDDYAFAGGKGDTVHATLMRMARASGHLDLAEAFAETGERHGLVKNDNSTLRALASHYSPSTRTLEHIRKVAGRLGYLDQTLGQLRDRKLGGPFAAPSSYGYDPVGMRNSGKNLGDLIDEYLQAATAREATKEAA